MESKSVKKRIGMALLATGICLPLLVSSVPAEAASIYPSSRISIDLGEYFVALAVSRPNPNPPNCNGNPNTKKPIHDSRYDKDRNHHPDKPGDIRKPDQKPYPNQRYDRDRGRDYRRDDIRRHDQKPNPDQRHDNIGKPNPKPINDRGMHHDNIGKGDPNPYHGGNPNIRKSNHNQRPIPRPNPRH